jgi:hypothetical protein
MPIDPKKIEEWGRDAALDSEHGRTDAEGVTRDVPWAEEVVALLAERETLLAEIGRLRNEPLPTGGRGAVLHCAVCDRIACGHIADEREELLALLREVEWVPDSEGDIGCRVCRQSVVSGHAPGCRLAAFIGRK